MDMQATSTPPTYCPFCNAEATWLTNGQLWCSRCQTSVSLSGCANQGGYFGLTPSQLNLGFIAVVGAIVLAAFFYFGGVGAVEGVIGTKGTEDLAANESMPSPPANPVSEPVSGVHSYPSSLIQNFLNACSAASGGQQDYCSCALQEIQARYTLEEYTVLEIKMSNTGELPEEMAPVIAKCIR